jgi:hypothetical protein
MIPLALRMDARADLVEAALWYEAQSPGLSEDLYESIGTALEAIAQRPGSFPVVRKDVRRAGKAISLRDLLPSQRRSHCGAGHPAHRAVAARLAPTDLTQCGTESTKPPALNKIEGLS